VTTPTVTCVFDCRVALAEGLAWHEDERRLYWVDILGPTINRFDPATGNNQVCRLDEPVGCIAFRRQPDERGALVAALASGFAFVNFDSGRVTPITDPEADRPDNRFNDGRAGPDGAFWAGTITNMPDAGPGAGALWRLAPDLTCHRMRQPVSIANGLAWSPDGHTLYHADTGLQDSTVQAWDFDPASGAMTSQRLFHDFRRTFPPNAGATGANGGRPDGACVDRDGGYWSAVAGGWAVARFHGDGRLDQTITLPVQYPTMPGFGGADLATLYISSIGPGGGLDLAPGQPQAGSLFACRPGVRGVAEYRFAS